MPFADINVIPVVAICVPVGGAFLTWMVVGVADAWRKAKVAEFRAVLVQNMVDKGFSPDDIERVLKADDGGRDKMSCKHGRTRDRRHECDPAHS
jgi:hypothetical protein